MFVVAIGFIGLNGYNAIKCVSMSSQGSKEIPITVNVNSNEPLFYPDSVTVNKWSGSCNDIDNPYSKLYCLDVTKNIRELSWVSHNVSFCSFL